jgi:hypothetical protein
VHDKKPKLTGIALGICLALLSFSLLSVFQSYAMYYLLVSSFGLIFVLGFALGIGLGVFSASHGYIPAMPLWGVLLTVLVGWPLCAISAVGLRISWMKWRAFSEVPIISQAQSMSVDIDWTGGDLHPPESCIKYSTGVSQQVVFAFYRENYRHEAGRRIGIL